MITYRFATPADADQIAALHARSWQTTYRGIMSDDYLDNEVEAERLAVWRERFAAMPATRQVILAENDGQLVGFTCVMLHDDPVYGALIDNLHADPAQKGRGIGRELMRRAAGWVREQATESPLYLWVYVKNRAAIGFYDRMGGTNRETVQHENGPVFRYVWPDAETLVRLNA